MSKKTIILCLLGCFMMCGVLVSSAVYFGQARKAHTTKVAANYPASQEKKKSPSKESKPATRVPIKSMEEKQKDMEADLPVMGTYGLYYDYANLNLVQVVQAYLDEMGIDHSQIAFSYKDLTSYPSVREMIKNIRFKRVDSISCYILLIALRFKILFLYKLYILLR